jgi:hypothetical protein
MVGDTTLEPLSALFDLPGGSFDGVIVAVAVHVAGPLDPGGIESWDLTLHGEAFEALSSDPFSFAGEFLYQGLQRIRLDLLEPAGFVVPSLWPCNEARTEFHSTIEWVPQRQTEFW